MTIEEFIEALTKILNLDAGVIEEQFGVTVEFDRRFDVTIEIAKSTHQAYLHAPVLIVPTENRDGLLALVLQLHMFGLATGGNTFGYDPQRSRLLLFRVLDLPNLAAASVGDLIESFVNQLERWAQHLSQFNPNATSDMKPLLHLQA